MPTEHDKRTHEMIARYHRVLRYENRLIKEGFRLAVRERIGVLLPHQGEDIDASGLVALGGRTLPALYRRTQFERARLDIDVAVYRPAFARSWA